MTKVYKGVLSFVEKLVIVFTIVIILILMISMFVSGYYIIGTGLILPFTMTIGRLIRLPKEKNRTKEQKLEELEEHLKNFIPTQMIKTKDLTIQVDTINKYWKTDKTSKIYSFNDIIGVDIVEDKKNYNIGTLMLRTTNENILSSKVVVRLNSFNEPKLEINLNKKRLYQGSKQYKKYQEEKEKVLHVFNMMLYNKNID